MRLGEGQDVERAGVRTNFDFCFAWLAHLEHTHVDIVILDSTKAVSFTIHESADRDKPASQRPVDVDDGGDDIFIVFPLVVVLIIGVDELVNDVGILLGHGLADLGAGVLGGGHPACSRGVRGLSAHPQQRLRRGAGEGG